MTVVGTLEAELKADPALWEAAMKRATESMEKLSARVEASSQKIRASNKAAEEAAGALQRLQGSARDLGERFSKVGAVTSGMGAAFGSAVPQMQGAVAAAAGLAQSFATGGPMLAGIALAGTVIGAVVSKLSAMKKEADDASAALAKMAQQSSDAAVRALNDATKQEQRLRLLRRLAAASPDQRDAITADEAARIAEADIGKKRAEIADLRRQQAEIEARGQRKVTYAEDADAAAKGLMVAVELGKTDKENLNTINKRLHDEQVILSTLEGQVDAIREEANLRAQISKSAGATKTAPAVNDNQDGASSFMLKVVEQDNLNAELARGSALLNQTLMGVEDTAVSSAKAFRGLGDVMRDARQRAEEQARAEERLAMQRAAFAADAIGSIGSGTVGTLALTTAGGIAGAAAGGPPGAMVGQALGQLLGPMADKLMASMGVLDPLMQSLSRVVSGLSPAFALLGAILDATVVPVLDILAPVVLAVTQAVSLFSVPMLRVAQLIMPYFMAQIAILVPVIELVSDVFMALVWFIDTYVFLPIAKVVTDLYNAVVDVINGLISGLNGFLVGLGIQGIALSTLSRMSTPQSLLDMGIAGQELTDSIDDNTDALRDFSKVLTNLPAGYRYALTEYASETPNGSGVGRRDMARGGALIINGNVNVMARDANVLEAIRRNMRERGVPFGGPIASAPPKRN